jgi:hypothetical protein
MIATAFALEAGVAAIRSSLGGAPRRGNVAVGAVQSGSIAHPGSHCMTCSHVSVS